MSNLVTSLNASCDGRCKAQGIKPLGFFFWSVFKKLSNFVKKLKSHFDVPAEYASIRFQLFASYLSFLNHRIHNSDRHEPRASHLHFFINRNMNFLNRSILNFFKYVLSLTILLQISQAHAQTENKENLENKTDSKSVSQWAKYYPYAPDKKEFQLELGGMWEDKNQYWMAGTIGTYQGQCFFNRVDSCQQFIDVTGGAGSRDSLTNGLLFLSYRTQFLTFPKPFSPSFRILVGAMNIRDDERDLLKPTYGLGAGWTATLHPKLDVKFEVRAGYADQFWSQTFLSFSFKIDRTIDDFSNRIQEFGDSAIKSTGKVIQTTIEAPKTFFDWFNKN
jgi:hypothetical protein